ncbi:CmcJ/NvfI family oxidoreductase [Thermopolyspora sp. NPDC052614]|uniref:CmcJ/NvfI family oxidoreductase n=1 Tax=Thermopolyspora sp. NPDC052614 TaxID=3155682 RepID=UPI003420C965
MTVADDTQIRTVQGELSYLAPESTVLRRFTAPGASVNTGIYRPYLMPIHDGRPISDRFTLDRNGFALFEHRSTVRDFTDRDEVDRVYPGEVAEFIKAHTGADRVATLGWTLRRAASPAANASQPQAALVHNDFSIEGAHERASSAYSSFFPDGPGYRRAIITSLWRVFSPPPQDWPLAICDYTSVRPGEGLPNRMYFVDRIPDDLYAEMPADHPGAKGFEFHHKPYHQWWYFPDMTRDEILLIKLNDSDRSVAWMVPHSAFHDRTAAATHPRHSIEFRSIAYFE